MKKRKTIENTILHSMRRTAFMVSLVVGVLCLLFMYVVNLHKIKSASDGLIKAASQRVSLSIANYKTIVEDLGTMQSLSSKDVPVATKKEILRQKCIEYNFFSSRIINLDGFSDMDEYFRGDEQYFQEAKNGKVVISDLLITKLEKKPAFFVASPVWKSGVIDSEVDSVVFCSIDPHFLVSMLNQISISKNSEIYIIAKDGTTVAALDEKLMLSRNNNIKNAEKNSKYKRIARLEKGILNGKTGARYWFSGLSLNCCNSVEIEGTSGWKMILKIPTVDYAMPFFTFFFYVLLIWIVCTVYILMKSKRLSKRVSVPVKKLSDRLRMAAEGDYTSDVVMDSNQLDEVKMISEATQSLMSRMDAILNGSDRYKESLSIEKLMEIEDFEPFLQYYKEKFKGTICIKDASGNILLGEENRSADVLLCEQLLLHDRFIGFVEMAADEDLKESADVLQNDLAVFAHVLTKLLETNLRKAVQYKAWRENEEITIKHVFEITEGISSKINDWLDDLDAFTNMHERKQLRQNFSDFTERAKSVLGSLSETFELIKVTDFKVTQKERDYSVLELIDSLGEKITSQFDEEDSNLIEITIAKNIARKLYGDSDGILMLLLRFATCIKNKNPSKRMVLDFLTVEKTYSCNLICVFILENGFLSDDEIKKIDEICQQSSKKLEMADDAARLSSNGVTSRHDEEISSIENYVAGFSQIYSVFKMAQFMNCETSIEADDGKLKIKIEIAQLEGGS